MPRPSGQTASVAFSSQGSGLFVKISSVFQEVFECYGLPNSGGDTPTIDLTTLGSTQEESLNDFPVPATYDFEVNKRMGDTTQQYLEALKKNGNLNDFEIRSWNGTVTETVAFAGRVTKFARNYQVRNAVKISMSIKQSGDDTATEV